MDNSFRDDLRLFIAWEASDILSSDHVRSWAWERFNSRCVTGTMELEASDPNIFIGVRTVWDHGHIVIRPSNADPWGAARYNLVDCNPLKPWRSWCSPGQKRAAAIGLFCRAWYLSHPRAQRMIAYWECLILLIGRAGYPQEYVFRLMRNWAKSWKPKAPGFPAYGANQNSGVVEHAISSFQRSGL